MKFILYAVYGCIIGVANIIPGVSGGTMAVILNVYDKLIDSVIGIKKHVKESLTFLIPVIIGERMKKGKYFLDFRFRKVCDHKRKHHSGTFSSRRR